MRTKNYIRCFIESNQSVNRQRTNLFTRSCSRGSRSRSRSRCTTIWIRAIGVVTLWIVATRIVATRIVASRIVASRILAISIGTIRIWTIRIWTFGITTIRIWAFGIYTLSISWLKFSNELSAIKRGKTAFHHSAFTLCDRSENDTT